MRGIWWSLIPALVAGYNGDMTFYYPGLGACGGYNGGGDWIVAMNSPQFDADKPCGKQVCITYKGKTQTATVVDRCDGCAYGLLDASPSLFSAIVGGLDAGKVGMSWSYGACGGKSPPKPDPAPEPKKPKPAETPEPKKPKPDESPKNKSVVAVSPANSPLSLSERKGCYYAYRKDLKPK